MAKAKIAAIVGEASIRKEMRGEGDRDSTALATRYLLQLLADLWLAVFGPDTTLPEPHPERSPD